MRVADRPASKNCGRLVADVTAPTSLADAVAEAAAPTLADRLTLAVTNARASDPDGRLQKPRPILWTREYFGLNILLGISDADEIARQLREGEAALARVAELENQLDLATEYGHLVSEEHKPFGYAECPFEWCRSTRALLSGADQ